MKLAEDFDKLLETYKNFLKVCDEALAPGKTQEQRNKVRDAIKQYLGADTGEAPVRGD